MQANSILPKDYPHKLTPFSHQKDHVENHWDSPSWALLWEQGTGKTKPIIDTACLLYLNGKINGLLIVAPPGVERNWKSDEITAHMIDSVKEDASVAVFQTAKKDNKSHKLMISNLMSHSGLSVLCISYNAFMTEEGKKTVKKFLTLRKCLYVLDEAHYIKSPDAKRTKTIVSSGQYAEYKRILTGTPISVGPFDLYSQIKFLDNNFWSSLGISNFFDYKHYFADFSKEVVYRNGAPQQYEKVTNYRNMDILESKLFNISDRFLKENVLDLPPKLYSKRYVELTKEQKDIYEKLKKEFIYEFSDGSMVDGEMPIVRLLRFQQVLCNYIPSGDENLFRKISDKNPRLEAIEDYRDTLHQPTIIWARFTNDIDQIMDVLGSDAVRYDGTISPEEAEYNKSAFQGGVKKWFVGTTQKGGPGLTLHKAKNVIYYSNSFKLIDRLQSEDRAHRAGMDDNPVHYIDIVCPDTIDEHIVNNLRNKKDIASGLLGDELKDWL